MDSPYTPVREGGVACPSEMIAVADAIPIFTVPAAGMSLEFVGLCALCPGDWSTSWINDLKGGEQGVALPPETIFERRRHGGRYNVVFCDGHVEGPKTKAFLDPRSDAILRQWSRDHQPHIDSSVLMWRGFLRP
jgi:prepilin-type processing-associated H-X9-DG protein